MRDVVASALGDRWPGAQVGSNRMRSRCFVNPNSRRPNPATLSPVRRRRPTGRTIAILYPCIYPAYAPVAPPTRPHLASPSLPTAGVRRQPQPPTAAHSSSSRVSPTLDSPIAAANPRDCNHERARNALHGEARPRARRPRRRVNSAPCSQLPRSSAASRTSLTTPGDMPPNVSKRTSHPFRFARA